MIEILPVSPQPNFPSEDLTPNNATTLESILHDSAFAESMHTQAEASNYLYRYAHIAINRMGRGIEFPANPIEAEIGFTHGAACYEIASSLVRPEIKPFTLTEIMRSVHPISSLSSDTIQATFVIDDAYTQMLEKQPLLAAAIQTVDMIDGITLSSEGRRAILFGAAVERLIELDALNKENINEIYDLNL